MNKNIFQVWYQGCNTITQNHFKENMKNWRLLNPDWNYHCLNDSDLRRICYKYSKLCGKAYDKSQFMHAKIDLGRMVAIYLHGGIMVDMDMYILRSLNTIKEIEYFENPKEHIIGLSYININFIESLIFSGNLESFNNAVVLSTQFNPLIKKWIDNMIDNIMSINTEYTDNYFYISKTTGPILFNKIITKHKNLSKIIKFEHDIFEPCYAVGPCNITNNTVSIHKFEMSWLSKELKFLAQMYFKYIRPNILTIITVLLAMLLYKRFNKFGNKAIKYAEIIESID
jgi:mannosyltransferase OCH1-like enzyme